MAVPTQEQLLVLTLVLATESLVFLATEFGYSLVVGCNRGLYISHCELSSLKNGLFFQVHRCCRVSTSNSSMPCRCSRPHPC